ncbi:alpha-amylase family glycosyl hydrolase [Opitutaceae bacterium]|nr:alpha-amylase family glycosyl hydrolase [Opitutaceae bacterium]
MQFGEVYNDKPEAPYVLSEFSTGMPMDTTLDFGFFNAARRFVSQQGNSAELAEFYATDDLYTDHDSNIHATPTFLGNHDAGRFPHFLQVDTPGIGTDEMLSLTEFAHGLLYLVRGSPVLYYGAEQGMIGTGGWDMRSRESMFASSAPAFRDAQLLGTDLTGADDKFDPSHPLYQFLAQMGMLRAKHQALRTGAMLVRPTDSATTFAFSRVERNDLVEYLAVFNRDRSHPRSLKVPTSRKFSFTAFQIRRMAQSRKSPSRPKWHGGSYARATELCVIQGELSFGPLQGSATGQADPPSIGLKTRIRRTRSGWTHISFSSQNRGHSFRKRWRGRSHFHLQPCIPPQPNRAHRH